MSPALITTACVALALGTGPPEQVLSYGRIPTWVGVATGWQTDAPKAERYSPATYPGHADYVSRGLGTGISFREFKAQVKDPKTRRYLPFFLYDLSTMAVRRDGRSYTWAVRLEAYGYVDDNASMARATIRLARLIEAERGSKGLVILARSPRVKPNQQIAMPVQAAGFGTATLQELLDSVGARAVEVLTPGKAVGTLRRAPGPTDPPLGPHDIAIFTQLPKRLPNVAAVITLEPQTPLSHINLLARNRQIPNLYARQLSALPGAEALVGQLIRMDAKGDRVLLRPISSDAAERWWAQFPPRRVRIPVAKPGGNDLFDLSRAKPTTSQVGAKAANYGRLRRLMSDMVRPGWALGFAPYFEVLKQSGAGPLSRRFLAEKHTLSPTQRKQRLKAIRATIKAGAVPGAALDAIEQLQTTHLKGLRIRLRSSTNCEDLPQFNGAGLYLSKGLAPNAGRDRLQKKLLAVYASLWRFRAFEERELFGIDHSQAAMAILINEAFVDELAQGVAITVPPDLIWINAFPGSLSVQNPPHDQVPESFRFRWSGRPPGRVTSRSSVGAVFLEKPTMAETLKRLAEQLRRVHSHFAADRKYGVDVEFKIQPPLAPNDAPRLFFKQVRLIWAPLPQ